MISWSLGELGEVTEVGMRSLQLSITLLSALCVAGQQAAFAKERADFSKSRIEMPLERIMLTPKDSLGIQRLVPTPATSRAAIPATPAAIPAAQTPKSTPQSTKPSLHTGSSAKIAKTFDNPKVQPGLVEWNTNFDTACAESRKSGKPVLLFHMMGNLDDRFC